MSKLGDLELSGDAREQEKHQWERDSQELQKQERLQLLDQRRRFANRFFWMAVVWLAFVAVAISLDGMKCPQWFDLDKEVAIALLATATANVFAPVVVAAKGIFQQALGSSSTK